MMDNRWGILVPMQYDWVVMGACLVVALVLMWILGSMDWPDL